MMKFSANINKWFKFIVGLALLLALFLALTGIEPPPGVAGEVLRHNRAEGIDASPLFYCDHDSMMSLEAGLLELMEGDN